ncbi:hypothetical protein KCU93_g11, partial [Aureobasidium melanogenum]
MGAFVLGSAETLSSASRLPGTALLTACGPCLRRVGRKRVVLLVQRKRPHLRSMARFPCSDLSQCPSHHLDAPT